MGVINKNSLIISVATGIPHGHRTVNGLPLRLIGIGTLKSTWMDADGGNQQRLTNNVHDDTDPAWFDPAFAVAPGS